MVRREYTRWAILQLGGPLNPDYLMGNYDTRMTTLFLTRAEARKDESMLEYNAMLKRRPDLRRPPHNWKCKRPVKVKVTVETV